MIVQLLEECTLVFQLKMITLQLFLQMIWDFQGKLEIRYHAGLDKELAIFSHYQADLLNADSSNQLDTPNMPLSKLSISTKLQPLNP